MPRYRCAGDVEYLFMRRHRPLSETQRKAVTVRLYCARTKSAAQPRSALGTARRMLAVNAAILFCRRRLL